jgi:pyruvate formate lyase activating enzyme
MVFDIDTFAVHDGPGIRLAVYLKGCPLACAWCHSPESLDPDPELIFLRDRCIFCGACAAVCPNGVHLVEAGDHILERDRCTACGQCVEQCPSGALEIKGRRITASEVVSKAERLLPFFRHSGGGITLTGGEVTCQPDFAASVLRACRSRGIHTAIETCGACSWEVLDKLLPDTDLVLYDLKLIDDQEHQQWTGASNRQILGNAALLAGRNVQVRVPLIPGITDTERNLGGIFTFMRSARLRNAALLPYNPSTAAKYEWLGRSLTIQGETQSRQQLDAALALARQAGIEAVIA